MSNSNETSNGSKSSIQFFAAINRNDLATASLFMPDIVRKEPKDSQAPIRSAAAVTTNHQRSQHLARRRPSRSRASFRTATKVVVYLHARPPA